jgi:hypothetical protein
VSAGEGEEDERGWVWCAVMEDGGRRAQSPTLRKPTHT